jgi:type III restriction enzyme
MKLKLKLQAYQTQAVETVADCFAGQLTTSGIQYRVDPDRAKKKQLLIRKVNFQ